MCMVTGDQKSPFQKQLRKFGNCHLFQDYKSVVLKKKIASWNPKLGLKPPMPKPGLRLVFFYSYTPFPTQYTY